MKPLLLCCVLYICTDLIRGQGSRRSLKPCDPGNMRSCFIAPCDGRTCAAFPQAECRNNYCGRCQVEFWVGDTEVTSHCDDAPGARTGIAFGEECQGRTVSCFSDPCATESCPGIPTAKCSRAPCECSAMFSNSGADVTEQCRQSRNQEKPTNQPTNPGVALGEECQGRTVRCFSDPCAFDFCPAIPDAVCSTSPCTCAAVFTSNGADVTQQCRESRNQVVPGPSVEDECQGRTMQCFTNACSHQNCPGIPNAVCSMSPCTCAAKFTSNGADVTQQCRDSQSQTTKTTQPAAPLGEECQGRTVRCFSNSCAFSSCSGVPDAVCSQSPCTCKAVFLLDGDDVTARCQSAGPTGINHLRRPAVKDLGIPHVSNVGSQKPSQPDDCANNCLFPPCLYSLCAAQPKAVCRNDYCNGCKARFFMGTTEVTTSCQDQIPSTGRARLFGGARSRSQGRQPARWQPQERRSRFLSPWLSLFNAMFQ